MTSIWSSLSVNCLNARRGLLGDFPGAQHRIGRKFPSFSPRNQCRTRLRSIGSNEPSSSPISTCERWVPRHGLSKRRTFGKLSDRDF